MPKLLLLPASSLLMLLAWLSGCSAGSAWHEKFDWRAKDYFEDPQVIALCEAIKAGDLKEIDRLVAAGANVKAKGKGNMTPLLWSYPDNKPDRFKRLLEHGADPNVIFESDFNTRMLGIRPGDSITHMVCETTFPHYFDYVFQHGGDPNLWHRENHETPLHSLIRGLAAKKKEKVKRLIELGANLDANIDNEYTGGNTPARTAISYFGQYDIALLLLQNGADYKAYRPNTNARLVHGVAIKDERLQRMSSQQRKDYDALVSWLEEHGESLEEARRDRERWRSWARAGIHKQMLEKEIAERKLREKSAAAEEAEVAVPTENRVREAGQGTTD